MKMVWFFLISTVVHAAILALPVARDHAGQGNAIPVTLVPSTINSAPVTTANVDTVKRRGEQILPEEIIQPEKVIEKPKINTANTNPTVKKKPVKAEPSKPSEPRKTVQEPKPQPIPQPVAVVAIPKDVRKVEAANTPESSDIPSHSETEDFYTSEFMEEDADGPALELAKLNLTSPPEKKAAPIPLPEREFRKATEGISLPGMENEPALFVGVKYAQIAKPRYPRQAKKLGWEGTTLLRVLVNRRGRTKIIEISRSSGYSALDKAAVKAVKRWRFHPARSGDTSVESWVKIPVVFDLEELNK